MKTLALTALAILACAGAAAAETRPIPVRELLSLDVSGPFRVEIITGPQTSAVLEGPAAALKRVESRVNGTKLQVRERGGTFSSRDDDIDVVLRVTAPILQSIVVSKGAEATATDLNTSTLTLNVSMGGALTATGRCNTLDARARMGGALDAEGLVCRTVTANASMGGAAHVHATESVQANASMGGTIDIAGKPAHHDASAFMGGIVDQD